MIDTEQMILDEIYEAEELRCRLLKLQDDFINYKKRVEHDRDKQIELASEYMILKILPVLDDLGRALRNVSADETNREWIQVIAMIHHNLSSILEKEGLSQIETYGKKFDPNEHEAVFTEEGKEEEQGFIRSVVLDGYKLGDKVIRPAQVSIIKGIKNEP